MLFTKSHKTSRVESRDRHAKWRSKKNYDMESAGDIVKWHYLVQPAKLKNRYLGTTYVPQWQHNFKIFCVLC